MANQPQQNYQETLNSIHSAGTWAIVLGLLNVIVTPLLQAFLYTKANSGGHSKNTLVLAAFVIGLIIGGVFIGLGIKLKRAKADTIRRADRTLLGLIITVLIVMLLSLVSGGRGVGLVNLLLLFTIVQARIKIKKLGPSIKSQPIPKGSHVGRWILIIVGGLVLVLIAGVVVVHALFKVYKVNGPSMSPNYSNGQQILVSNTYTSPKIEDVVLFHEPPNNNVILIKRIVALGGDKVVIQNGALTVFDNSNPRGFDPDSAFEPSNEVTPGDINTTVPQGDVYVLGDNRSDSLDSRIFGPVPVQDVIGKVVGKL